MEQRGVKEGDRQDVFYQADQSPFCAGLVWFCGVFLFVCLCWGFFLRKGMLWKRLKRLQV